MDEISCPLTYIPIRSEPKHASEQVSQLIYGETALVTDENKEWYQIETSFDNYKGWLEKKVISKISAKNRFINNLIYTKESGVSIPIGAELPNNTNEENCKASIEEIGLSFLNTPYLWGGRTHFGIDCSGLSQIINKCLGKNLPRDASQQVEYGFVVNKPEDAVIGDLAFFINEKGKTTHVGIVWKNQKILHASGKVKLDTLKKEGIFDEELNQITHKLSVIKHI